MQSHTQQYNPCIGEMRNLLKFFLFLCKIAITAIQLKLCQKWCFLAKIQQKNGSKWPEIINISYAFLASNPINPNSALRTIRVKTETGIPHEFSLNLFIIFFPTIQEIKNLNRIIPNHTIHV